MQAGTEVAGKLKGDEKIVAKADSYRFNNQQNI
jgi:hypothetical protein